MFDSFDWNLFKKGTRAASMFSIERMRETERECSVAKIARTVDRFRYMKRLKEIRHS